MNLYDTFETDKSAERDGIVLDYGFNSKKQPLQIRIARAGGSNVRFSKALELKTRPYKRAIANDSLDPQVAEKLMIEVYADTVVLGWTGVEDREGNALEFNRENVVKVLTDLPDLFADIQQQSQKAALFRAKLREDDAGNSPSS